MKIIVFSGHMVDQPGRTSERFPPRKEKAVRNAISEKLDEWVIGEGDIAICGGARGGDILFAELCQGRGVQVILLIALPKEEFLRESVRLPNSDWEERLNSLMQSSEVRYQHEYYGPPPEGVNVFERNNLWCIETAKEYTGVTDNYALLLWDEKPTGDGPGGTSHFYKTVKQLGWSIFVINPTALD